MTNKTQGISTDGYLSEQDEIILRHRMKAALDEHKIADMERSLSRHFEGGSPTSRILVRIAAVVVLIISVPALLIYMDKSAGKSIFHDYYSPYKRQNITGIYRGMNSEEYTPYMLYTSGNFSMALPEIRQFLDKNPADLQARLLFSICLIEGRHFNEAELELTEILVASDFYFRDDALWYLALLSVRKGDFQKACKFLRPIRNHKVYGSLVQSLEKTISR